jgi:quercetin dioxygenase-like cupin family protein
LPTMFRTLSVRYDHGHEIGEHEHDWGQLVFAASGAIHVTTPAQTWLIPSARAVWLPPRTEHRLRMRGTTNLRTIYVPPAHGSGLPDGPLGVSVAPSFGS